MGVLNVTPDSFSDGGKFLSVDSALLRAEKMISEGANIIDVGGESTRPQSEHVSIEDELRRVIPVIESIASRFDIPISIDSSKNEVVEVALNSGAEIINDISGLRFDERIGETAARLQAGLVLMHMIGTFDSMHEQKTVADIMVEVANGFRMSLTKAANFGVSHQQVVLDIGIGFSKTHEQNLELLANLDKLKREFPNSSILVGTSRKSFIGKILGGLPVNERVSGSLASIAIAVFNGARVVRIHDVKESVEAVKIAEEIGRMRRIDD